MGTSARVVLADDSECDFNVYVAWVTWDAEELRIFVDESDAQPMVGMELLNGYELNMQVRHRGKVTIKRLPAKRR